MDFNNTILDNTAERTITIEENKFVWKQIKMLLKMLLNAYIMSTDGLLIDVQMIDLCNSDLDHVFDVFDDETSSD